MTTVLVTGGHGFLGRWVCAGLESRGYDVVAFDHAVPVKQEYESRVGDIRSATDVNQAFAHADRFVHLAGVLGTQETIQNPLPAAETNVIGAVNVLQAAAEYDTPGSFIAVGNWWMANTYAITKYLGERFVEMYNRERGTWVQTVRAMNAYGPGQSVAAPYGPAKVRKIIPSFVMRALHDDPIQVYGSGEQIMDMVWAGDVATVLIAAMEQAHEGHLHPVIEIGTGRPTTVEFIADRVIEACGQGDVEYLPMRPGEEENAVVLADTSTLAPLGMGPNDLTSLETGLAETVAWFRKEYGL